MNGIKENPAYTYFPSFKALKQTWEVLNIRYTKNKTGEKKKLSRNSPEKTLQEKLSRKKLPITKTLIVNIQKHQKSAVLDLYSSFRIMAIFTINITDDSKYYFLQILNITHKPKSFSKFYLCNG